MSVYKPTGFKKIFHNSKRLLATSWLSMFHPTQIAITGSQGKTGTTEIITALARALGNTMRTDINLDTTYNVPITALKVTPITKYLIWELGIDHPGEMKNHLEIANPTIGVITGISPVHTDAEHMGSLETLISEKRKLIECLPTEGVAILNYDDDNVQQMAPHTKAHLLWYGTNPQQCNIYFLPDSVHISADGTQATFTNNHSKETINVQTSLIGAHHLYNLMAGYLALSVLSKDPISDIFKTVIAEMKPLRGRMSIEKGPLDTVLLNDSLRANPASTNAGLDTLSRFEHTSGKKIAVIGEMGELLEPEKEHRETGHVIAKYHFDYVICIGPLRKYTIEAAIQKGFPQERMLYAKDVFEAADLLKTILQPGDLWYLKGSLLRNYKRIIQLLNNEPVCCHENLCPYNHCGF